MKIKDRLFGEVDDSCGICGLRGRQILTTHHIDHDDKNNVDDNQIVLCHNCHKRYHDKKGLSKDEIRTRKRGLIAKTLTTYGLNALKIAKRKPEGVVAMPYLLFHLVELGFMQQHETQMTYGPIEVTARFAITEKGSKLLDNWFS